MIGKTFVVGFVGQARSGKDTSVDLMVKYADVFPDIKGRRYAFADALKHIYNSVKGSFNAVDPTAFNKNLDRYVELLPLEKRAAAFDYFDWLRSHTEQMVTPLNDDTKALHRPLLIDLGMKMRELDADYWVKPVKKQIEVSALPFAFISDCRFENERSILDSVIRVVRPGCEIIYDPVTGKVSDSEIMSLTGDFNHIIPNHGNLNQLRSLVHIAAGFLLHERECKMVLNSYA